LKILKCIRKTKIACGLALLEGEEWGRKGKKERKIYEIHGQVLPLFPSTQNPLPRKTA